MSRAITLISLALLCFSLASHAEINLVKNNQAISLMSSAERASLGIEPKQVEELCKSQAQTLCSQVGKKFKNYVLAQLSPENIKEKSYQAMVWQPHSEGLSFTETSFPIVVFPEKIPPLVQIEHVLYAASGIIFAAGGLMTLMMCIDTYGPTGSYAAKITAGITAGLSAISSLGGASIHIRRSYLETKNKADDDECSKVSSIATNYALPVLVSELWCE